MANHKKPSPKYSVAVRDRAVYMLLNHTGDCALHWAAVEAIDTTISEQGNCIKQSS